MWQRACNLIIHLSPNPIPSFAPQPYLQAFHPALPLESLTELSLSIHFPPSFSRHYTPDPTLGGIFGMESLWRLVFGGWRWVLSNNFRWEIWSGALETASLNN